MITRILVPLDGSVFSECVIPLVRALAGRTSRVCIDLAHVHSGNAGANTSTFESRLEREERAQMGGYLTTKAEQLRAESRTEVTTSLLDGAVVPALEAHVKRTGPDLIAMTTHGRGGVIRAASGSVAEDVIRHISIPVLLVRPDIVPARDALPVFRRILIPVDDSDISASIMPYALDLAGLAGVAYYLVSVVHPSPELDGFPGTFGTDSEADEKLLADACTQATNRLATIANEVAAPAGAVRMEVIVDAEAGSALLGYATAHDIDLIALSTHSKGAVARLLTGSTADIIIRGADVPVLVFHGK